MLAYIGYDVSLSLQNNFYFNSLIKNYQNHYLQNLKKENSFTITYVFIEKHFCNLLLTKLKK